jgi:hypothetical protein
MKHIRHLSASIIAIGLTFSAAIAEELPIPSGEILLTVSGAVGVTNVGESAQFDLTNLKSLGEASFVTTTPWTEGPQTFSGVSLKAVLDRLDVREGNLMATAINDYAVKIPVSDAVEGGPIIAYLRNGEPMSVRNNGPLWIVYPYDASEDYQAEVIYTRSIWQLDRIAVSD